MLFYRLKLPNLNLYCSEKIRDCQMNLKINAINNIFLSNINITDARAIIKDCRSYVDAVIFFFFQLISETTAL